MPIISIEVTDDQLVAIRELIKRGVVETEAQLFQLALMEAFGLAENDRLLNRAASQIMRELYASGAISKRGVIKM